MGRQPLGTGAARKLALDHAGLVPRLFWEHDEMFARGKRGQDLAPLLPRGTY